MESTEISQGYEGAVLTAVDGLADSRPELISRLTLRDRQSLERLDGLAPDREVTQITTSTPRLDAAIARNFGASTETSITLSEAKLDTVTTQIVSSSYSTGGINLTDPTQTTLGVFNATVTNNLNMMIDDYNRQLANGAYGAAYKVVGNPDATTRFDATNAESTIRSVLNLLARDSYYPNDNNNSETFIYAHSEDYASLVAANFLNEGTYGGSTEYIRTGRYLAQWRGLEVTTDVRHDISHTPGTAVGAVVASIDANDRRRIRVTAGTGDAVFNDREKLYFGTARTSATTTPLSDMEFFPVLAGKTITGGMTDDIILTRPLPATIGTLTTVNSGVNILRRLSGGDGTYKITLVSSSRAVETLLFPTLDTVSAARSSQGNLAFRNTNTLQSAYANSSVPFDLNEAYLQRVNLSVNDPTSTIELSVHNRLSNNNLGLVPVVRNNFAVIPRRPQEMVMVISA